MRGPVQPRDAGAILRGRLATWLALLALLGATVLLAYAPLRGLNGAASLGIAALKAMLVAWVFMKLQRPDPLRRIFAVASLLWIGFLFALIFADVASRA